MKSVQSTRLVMLIVWLEQAPGDETMVTEFPSFLTKLHRRVAPAPRFWVTMTAGVQQGPQFHPVHWPLTLSRAGASLRSDSL